MHVSILCFKISLSEMKGFFMRLPFIKLFYRSSQLQEITINSFVDLR